MNGGPFLPVSVYSGLELSTLLQGVSMTEGDYGHLPLYLRTLMDKVLKKRADSEGVPAANPKVSVAKITVDKTKLSQIASATETAKTIAP